MDYAAWRPDGGTHHAAMSYIWLIQTAGADDTQSPVVAVCSPPAA